MTLLSAERIAAETLLLDIDGYEGPLDILLTLARTQKVDLRHISILQLAEQYLGFIETARALRIELAADYLVMAAWLAFLKSRLLLPQGPDEEDPSGEDLAAHLAFQLERLQAMRDAAARLMALDQLGRERFVRGQIEHMTHRRKIRYSASLLDLMQGYARLRTKDEFRPYAFDREDVYTLDQALSDLRHVIGRHIDWTDLERFLPRQWQNTGKRRRAAVAMTFAAALQLTKEGQVDLRQQTSFAPIEMRAKETRNG